MEHFEERIAPKLKDQITTQIIPLNKPRVTPYSSGCKYINDKYMHTINQYLVKGSPIMIGIPRVRSPFEQEVTNLKNSIQSLTTAYKSDFARIRLKVSWFRGRFNYWLNSFWQFTKQNKQIKDLQTLCREQKTQISEHEERINDLSKRLLDLTKPSTTATNSAAASHAIIKTQKASVMKSAILLAPKPVKSCILSSSIAMVPRFLPPVRSEPMATRSRTKRCALEVLDLENPVKKKSRK